MNNNVFTDTYKTVSGKTVVNERYEEIPILDGIDLSTYSDRDIEYEDKAFCNKNELLKPSDNNEPYELLNYFLML